MGLSEAFNKEKAQVGLLPLSLHPRAHLIVRDGLGLGPEVVLATALVQTQRRVQGLEGELLQQNLLNKLQQQT